MASTGNTGRKQGNRSGSGNRNSSRNNSRSRQTANTRKTVQEDTISSKLLQEILLIAVFAVCVFLFLCNFGIMGSVGGFFRNLQFGLFGLPAYVVPILIFIAVVFYISNEGSKTAVRKLISGIILYFLTAMLCELFAGRLPEMESYRFAAFYKDAAEHHNGGGVIAGSLAYLAYHYLSMLGTVLLVIVLALICIVLLTERSLIGGAKKGGRVLAERVRSREARYEEEYDDGDYDDGEESPAERRARLRAEKQERLAERIREQEERDRRRQEELEERGRRRREEQEERLRHKQKQQEDRLREKQLVKEEKEDEKILRMNKKSRGVMLDTKLRERETFPESSDENRDDMHEIRVQDFIPGESFPEEKEEKLPFYRREAEIDEVQEISYPDYQEDVMAEETGRDPGEMFSRKTEYSGGISVEPPELCSFYEKELERMPEPITEFSPDRISQSKSMPESMPKPVPEKAAKKPDDVRIQLTEKGLRERPAAPAKKYEFPPVTLLRKGKGSGTGDSNKELKETALRLQQTLENFGVRVTVTEISQGPAVTRYEMQPEQGVKVSKIVGLSDDIKLNLAATDIRIEAPIPGKAAVGIEVPNREIAAVAFRDLIESPEYKKFESGLAFAVGKDIGGKVVVTDIAKMPHMLIAGATGSGKSVCINTIIMSILYKAHPDDVKLIMIDPKVVELSVYNGIPHLLLPVVTDPKKAAGALHWGVAEMTERYNKFAEQGVRDLKGYNQKAEQMQKKGAPDAIAKMPQIVIIVDELADLMMVAPGEVEESICRLAQLARAAGIHLIIATQRPSVDVITGLIKANMPSRVAFAVSSGVDSRTILDMVGAEKLLGKGDMLFYPQGYPKPARIQGAFVSDEEVQDVVEFLKAQNIISRYSPDIEQEIKTAAASPGAGTDASSAYDEYFAEAGRFIIEKDKASIGMLQRVFKIGFNRAARIMDQLCEAGVVGEEEGTKPRKVLMSPEQFESFVEESV